MRKATRYYLISALFSASRMGIGAVSVVYMLQSGVSLNDVASIKIVQALVIFFAEVPTGLVADTFGRRASLFMAAVTSILSFLIFGLSDSVIGFSIAEILNGLCIAFWSGAFEAIAVEDTREENSSSNFIELFFARMGTFNAFATMIGGLIGGWLGESNLIFPFVFSGILMTSTLFLMFFLLPKDREPLFNQPATSLVSRFKAVVEKMHHHQSEAWRFSISNHQIRQFFAIQICIQFAIQPLLHYWQPYFQNLSDVTTTRLLGLIFFGYVCSQMLISGIVSRLFEKNRTTPEAVNSWTALTTFVGFGVLLISNSFLISVSAFLVLQGAIGVLRNNLSANFNRFANDEDRATILSAVSFISRIGMVVNLIILNLTLNQSSISTVFVTSFLGMAFVVIMVQRWNRNLLVRETLNDV